MSFTDLPTGSSVGDNATRVLERNRRRRRVRRWIAIGATPVAIAATVFAVKLLSMFGFAHGALVAHAAGDDVGTVRNAEWLNVANWFEPYIAAYDRGVGLASAEDLTPARAAFESALTLVEGVASCPVGLNLTLVIEMQGDLAADARDGDGARARWTEALDIAQNLPEVCTTDEASERSTDPRRDFPAELDDTIQRILEKLNQPEPPPPPPSGGEDDPDQQQPPQTPQDKLDQIEDLLQQGQVDRDDLDTEGGSGGGTDKPW